MNIILSMKKLFLLLTFALLVPVASRAQFTRFGAQLGNGVSYVSDDLLLSKPIFGFQLGGYVDYEFTNWKNPWSENLYIRIGLNFTRRGTQLEQVWVLQKSIRQSFLHNWYAQIPVYVGFRYEIPSLLAGNYVNFFFGPTFNVGLYGRYRDRQVMPGMPQASNNYDTFVTGTKDDRSSFKHIRRFDGSVVGAGYQWRNYSVDLIWDHGFVPLLRKDDVLAPFDRNVDDSGNISEEGKNHNAYTGVNQSYIIASATSCR